MDYRLLNEKGEKDRKLMGALFNELDAEFFPTLSGRYKDVLGFADHYAGLGSSVVWLGVFEGGKLIGAAAATLGTTGECGELEKNPAYTWFLGVLKPFRRKQLAVSLSKRFEEILRGKGVKTLYVRTWSTNDGAVNIYKKLGFRITHIAQNERAPGVHSVYFKKSL